MRELYQTKTIGVNRCLTKQCGFTLLELAIVLFIVGLLYTGIIKAAAIYANAKVHSDLRKLESMQSAFMLYKDKYHQLPGEDTSHPGRLKTVLSSQAANEGLFYELRESNFITQAELEASIGDDFKATWGGSSGANYGLIAGMNQICITQIDTDLASVIEAKLDNGDQYSGDFRYTTNGSQLCMLLR